MIRSGGLRGYPPKKGYAPLGYPPKKGYAPLGYPLKKVKKVLF